MSRLRPALYFLRQAWLQLVRDRNLSGTAVLANLATLFVSALFLLIAFNLHAGLRSIEAEREVQVFLVPGGEAALWNAVGDRLRGIGGVAEAILITPDDALAEFERDFGESGLEAALGENPLPASYRLSLSEGARKGEALERIAGEANGVQGVESVRYGGRGIAEVESRVRVFAVLNLIVGLLAGLSAILIVANTIRLTIIARQDLVRILKLIGAHDDFVRWPFLLEGMIQGTLAGTGALILLRAIHSLISTRIAGTLFFSGLPVVSFLLFAALLGGAGAYLATLGPLRAHWSKS